MEFSDLNLHNNLSYMYVSGTITNTGNRTFYGVTVTVEFKNKKGEVIDTKSELIHYDNDTNSNDANKFIVYPNKTYDFRVKTDNMNTYKYSIYVSDYAYVKIK